MRLGRSERTTGSPAVAQSAFNAFQTDKTSHNTLSVSQNMQTSLHRMETTSRNTHTLFHQIHAASLLPETMRRRMKTAFLHLQAMSRCIRISRRNILSMLR